MKRRQFALIFGVSVLGLLVAPLWAAADLTGTWSGYITDPMGKHEIVLRLKVEGSSITGTLSGGPGAPPGVELPLSEAKLAGDQLSFKVKGKGFEGETVFYAYEGKVTGEQIKGTHAAPFGKVPWEVKRK